MSFSRAQRLAIAGVVAPHLREQIASGGSRRVARVDATGNVVGYTTLAEIQKSLLALERIEIDVLPGVRPKRRLCELCEKPFAVPVRSGPPATLCRKCSQPKCLDCPKRVDRVEVQRCKRCAARHTNAGRKKSRPCKDCGVELPRTSRAARGGGRCAKCHLASRKTATCPNGHAFTVSNTALKTNGARRCKQCARDYARSRKQTVPPVCPVTASEPDNATHTDPRNTVNYDANDAS